MGIQTRDFFWPMNKQKIYKKMGLFKGQNFPIAEYLGNNGFYIPSGLGLKKTEMIKICKCINKIL
jgi:perosamine synthetase